MVFKTGVALIPVLQLPILLPFAWVQEKFCQFWDALFLQHLSQLTLSTSYPSQVLPASLHIVTLHDWRRRWADV